MNSEPVKEPVARRVGVLSRLGRWADDNVFIVWFVVAATMFLLAAASVMLGIHVVSFPEVAARSQGAPIREGATHVAVKEVGYIAALNWAFYSIAVAPFMAVLALRVCTTMSTSLQSIADADMVRDETFAPVPAQVLLAQWRSVQPAGLLMLGFIVFAVLGYVMFDWWTVVAAPMLDPTVLEGVRLTDPTLEFDWSIASLFEGARTPRAPLLVFGFIAYLLIAGLFTAVTFGVCIYALYFVAFVTGHVRARGVRWRLAAVPCGATDERAGFGQFSPFFTAFIGLGIAVVFGCLLMIVQNAYLRDATSEHLGAFVFGERTDFISALTQSLTEFDIGEIVKWVFAPTMNVYNNPQTGIGTLLLGFTCIVCFGASWGLLHGRAKAARDYSIDHADQLSASCGLSSAELLERLKTMELWSLGWLKLRQLQYLLLALCFALISYRGVVVVGTIISIPIAKWLFDFAFNRNKPAVEAKPAA